MQNCTPPSQKRLLLVENELSDAARLVAWLTAAGFDIDVASNFDDGLRHGIEYDYDAALIDLNLSRSSTCEGIDLISQLRVAKRTYPIVILTRCSSIESEVTGFEAGADDYIIKWPLMESLQRRVSALICAAERNRAISGRR